MQIKKTLPAKRCDVCHQADCFDQTTSLCKRCKRVDELLIKRGMETTVDQTNYESENMSWLATRILPSIPFVLLLSCRGQFSLALLPFLLINLLAYIEYRCKVTEIVVSGFDWLEIRKRDKSTRFRISEIERVKIIDPTILRNLKIVTAKGKKRFSLSEEALEDVKVLIRYLKPNLVKHL